MAHSSTKTTFYVYFIFNHCHVCSTYAISLIFTFQIPSKIHFSVIEYTCKFSMPTRAFPSHFSPYFFKQKED